MQPAFMQAAMQSQQAWHMSQQSVSPEVQVKQTPILVSVHSHLHIVKQQLQTGIPFIMQQQLHMLPASILHMFCKVAAATSSSQVQVILNPPAHFSIFIVQRGTMHICMLPGIELGIDAPPIGELIDPIGFIMVLSIIIMLAIQITPSTATGHTNNCSFQDEAHKLVQQVLNSWTGMGAASGSSSEHRSRLTLESLPWLGSAQMIHANYNVSRIFRKCFIRQSLHQFGMSTKSIRLMYSARES